MINLSYLISELVQKKRRSLTSLLLVALAIGLLVFINTLAGGLQAAFRAPLADIGANMTVQRGGDVPEAMTGPVFPCSVVPISAAQIKVIRDLPGIQSLSQALLFWDFSSEKFQIVVGFHPAASAGPALLRTTLTAGRFLQEDDSGKAMVDQTWAQANNIQLGDEHTIADRPFKVIGLVDSSQISKVATAHIYIPLNEARAIAAASTGITEMHTFGARDANILFIRADRDATEPLAAQIKQILGKEASVSTPDSFKKMLGSLFVLTDRFSRLISILALLITLILVARTAAAGIRERMMEIGTMKTVGWTGGEITRQLGMETTVLVLGGAVLGLGIGLTAAWLATFMTIAIPIPWDMAPTPHFLPGGEEQLTKTVNLTMQPSIRLLIGSMTAALLIAVAAVWTAARAITGLKPSEVLRYE